MWPQYILDAFASIPPGSTQESDYYAPYDALLNYLFPPPDGFLISPQHREPDMNDSVDLTVIYLVMLKRHVVFFLEVKPSGHITHAGSRARADRQVRQRYLDVFESSAPVLHSLSALGTRLCFYTFDRATRVILPPPIQRDPELVNDTAPPTRWSLDLLSPDGEDRARSTAQDVRRIAAALG